MRKRGLVISGAALSVSATLLLSCLWYLRRYQPDFRALLYTAVLPLSGTGTGVFAEWAANVLPGLGVTVAVYALVAALVKRHRGARRMLTALCWLSLPIVLGYGWHAMGIGAYIADIRQQTDIYDTEYVDPQAVRITADQPRNLICLYIESMETAYASREAGGYQEINYIPGLTELAAANISFSDTEALGGFQYMTGASWTMGALMTSTSGVPFAFPVTTVRRIATERFAPEMTSLGDILAAQGYTQEFLCGSDASFGGRRTYFEQHGGYAVFDLNEAKRQGYVPQDYHVWWGLEDTRLYGIARDELTRLSAQEEPFNLTILTADTHFPDGYLCEACGNAYDTVTGNVVACADSQAAAFVRWCMAQDFAEDTVIVVMGDHQRMDTSLVGHIPYGERPVYNCIINAAREPAATTGRIFTAADMFPTVLSAMGFDIEGHRLGLGTDLFSGEPTLAERMGIDVLNEEVSRSSKTYVHSFAE